MRDRRIHDAGGHSELPTHSGPRPLPRPRKTPSQQWAEASPPQKAAQATLFTCLIALMVFATGWVCVQLVQAL